ncbi:MRN complex-interacting protein isoform X2 [Archocentrus centrarchus]|uniref:MRN complex-interacting protein isoform X2 n=1 Tax=Archocentrus centrarchus TaxID=63155 RepID=UPI0011EA223A|nr:MRN complex-interacting protein isoform X2 [Archocentrus centrarchus]
MGQEFHVLRCFSCQSFQVHQVKKASRWSCKLCGEKQSLLKEQQEEEEEQRDKQVRQAQTSRWSKYLDTPEEAEPEDEAEPEENDLVNRKQLDGNKMAERKRKRAKEAGPEDGHTPEQLNCLKPRKPSATTTCSPAPCSPATRWSCFLSPECKVQEEEPAVCGQTQSLGGASDPSRSSIISRPHPLLPASSMFESGEEFNFDDDFLTQV